MLVVAVAAAALLAAFVAGALTGGSWFQARDPVDVLELGARVEPFIGLPPPGAAPSRPEAGKLVLEAGGRCTDGGSFCFVWIYSDGRLIWIRDGASPFGANERSTGLIEQRLAPSGVEHLVATFAGTGACRGGESGLPVVCAPAMPGPAPFPSDPASRLDRSLLGAGTQRVGGPRDLGVRSLGRRRMCHRIQGQRGQQCA
jgi:hypothetical protein